MKLMTEIVGHHIKNAITIGFSAIGWGGGRGGTIPQCENVCTRTSSVPGTNVVGEVQVPANAAGVTTVVAAEFLHDRMDVKEPLKNFGLQGVDVIERLTEAGMEINDNKCGEGEGGGDDVEDDVQELLELAQNFGLGR
ncbi:OLC1v1017280C1 [Oldenlandia corymbosa var. corymbosa]|uniref:OLC1v1017280C1 n=1 Tax=Oldenlandia corymbosa var. corymbosa TaxID=529605 RepID=A0AAV1E923_OLDCO|nr:OLC1v1017280C1 [Oldenlandia corymbosa var. corymbosa]